MTGIEVTVESARKSDAGRAIARLPELVRHELGVLSGDPVVIDGEDRAVAKVWPGTGSERTVRIDAETRAAAGVAVGDSAAVRPIDLSAADRVVVGAADADREVVASRLRDRPVRAGQHLTLDGVGGVAIRDTDPEGPVQVTAETTVLVREARSDDDSEAATDGVTYEDIGGLDDELDRVRETVEVPLQNPERFERLGIDPPAGVLLYGPPGTGKTLIARAVANEVDAHFEVISGPEVVSKYKGESERRLREVFDRAAENAPAIVFVDEIDSIGGTRDDDADMENRVVAQLLTLLDGLEPRQRVVVVGATNRVDAMDEALRRGGRFDREVEIGVPDREGRREILAVQAREMPIDDSIDLDRIADRTHGFVGADLETLVTEAAMAALRADRDDDRVTRADLDTALAAVEPSAMREYVVEAPDVDFSDVGGLEEAKRTLERAVEWPLQYGPLFEATDTDPPSGVLLYGPPGTGKTLLVRALAGETDANVIHVAGPELLDRYVGESEAAVREIFERARQTAPAIVFVDELDAIASQRGGAEVTDRVVSQLLTELDGLVGGSRIVVIGATNRLDAIDPALKRPGRLEELVEVGLPDREARERILRIHLDATPLADVPIAEIAADLEGYSGADIAAVVRDASLRAIDRVVRDLNADEVDATERVAADAAVEAATDEVRVTEGDLRAGIESVAPTGER
ncbi:AAA family ATPase [Halococcoides cellulosivorans]|uniref:AAA family ATPase n=1 Tax=Halococcoides cellulosivorans TaxID=1679096 RepID=A0A2R4WZC0_9EURY|nr:AAA family ATPase [Halococcoides cellulosivorans]AWB26889.1 AAA family ATPase [Halococcoides cellulosivorans]